MISYILSETVFEEGLGLHVVMRQTQRALDLCVTNYGDVETLEDLQTLCMNYPYKNHTLLPGLLSHFLVVFVKETQSAALILNGTLTNLVKSFASSLPFFFPSRPIAKLTSISVSRNYGCLVLCSFGRGF
jgi:hypothetical protein